jgi:hypothetical protein
MPTNDPHKLPIRDDVGYIWIEYKPGFWIKEAVYNKLLREQKRMKVSNA